MNTVQTFTILFWIKKNCVKKGKAPLFTRITIAGKRIELSANREVSILEWDTKGQRVGSRGEEAKEINNHLSLFKSKLLNCYGKLEMRGIPITAEMLKNEYNGVVIEERPRMLLQIIQQHNKDIKTLIGKDYARAQR